jgi:hypothetical protein
MTDIYMPPDEWQLFAHVTLDVQKLIVMAEQDLAGSRGNEAPAAVIKVDRRRVKVLRRILVLLNECDQGGMTPPHPDIDPIDAREQQEAEIERLRAERDDLMKANALLHVLIGNREAEIEQLRADKDVRSR